jgi:hypothetical protein
MTAEDGSTRGPELANGHLGRKYQDVLTLWLQVRQTEARMFQPGDPIRLSKLGEDRIKRPPSKTGRVVRGTGGRGSSQHAVRVQFDGMKHPVNLHLSYIELLDPKDNTNAGEMKAR